MSDSVNLSTFPSGKVQGLTLLYMQNQDLKGKTPEELALLYTETYSRINEQFRAIRHGTDNLK